MLRQSEKKAAVTIFLLGIGAPLALDRWYEGDYGGAVLATLGFVVGLLSIVGILVWGYFLLCKLFRELKKFEAE